MWDDYELRLPLERITDEEIASAIRYLDPDYPKVDLRRDHTDTILVVSIKLIILLAGTLAYIWLWLRIS